MEYMFNNPSSMISLARFIQTKIYWGSSFRIEGSEDLVKYSHFWDHIESYMSEIDLLGVYIKSNVVTLIMKGDN